MKLKNKFKSLFSFDKEPKIKCRVKGFELSISQQEKGQFLKAAGSDECLNEPQHYTVSARPTGVNPEYPEADKASEFHFVRLKEEAGGAYGMAGGVCFIPHDAKWTRFELAEQFNRGRDYSGHQPADHHGVSLKAYFKRADGKESSMGVGSANWVRKSDLESDAWKRAARNKTIYM